MSCHVPICDNYTGNYYTYKLSAFPISPCKLASGLIWFNFVELTNISFLPKLLSYCIPHCRLSPQTSISNPCDPGDPGQVVRNPPVGHFLIPVNFGDPGKIYWNMQSRNWNVQFNPCAVLPRRIECFGIKMFYFCDSGQWSWSAAIPVILVTSQ